jgi:hypothetical protein
MLLISLTSLSNNELSEHTMFFKYKNGNHTDHIIINKLDSTFMISINGIFTTITYKTIVSNNYVEFLDNPLHIKTALFTDKYIILTYPPEGVKYITKEYTLL